MSTTTEIPLDDTTIADLAKIETSVTDTITLADLIREGSKTTTPSTGWGSFETACALSAAALAARDRGIIS